MKKRKKGMMMTGTTTRSSALLHHCQNSVPVHGSSASFAAASSSWHRWGSKMLRVSPIGSSGLCARPPHSGCERPARKGPDSRDTAGRLGGIGSTKELVHRTIITSTMRKPSRKRNSDDSRRFFVGSSKDARCDLPLFFGRGIYHRPGSVSRSRP
jgi:hypothetical protein